MLLTEEEAQTKWCPFAKVAISGDRAIVMPGPSAVIRDDGGDVTNITINCVGSACMAWRKACGEYDKLGNLPGYCGAFGKPE